MILRDSIAGRARADPILRFFEEMERNDVQRHPNHVRYRWIFPGTEYHPQMTVRRSRASSGPPFRLDPALDFMRLLWSIEHGLQSTSKRMGAHLGITGPQRLVLKIVAQFPGISAKDVAHIVRLHPSTLTGILQRLVDKRLLARERDPVDGRRVRLRVCPPARLFTRGATGTVEAAVARALARVRPESVRRAREVLSAIADALDVRHTL